MISVIVPYFNAEAFLGEAISSVLAQTHERCELLLIDDGSSDGSQAIAKGFCAAYPDKVSHFQHPEGENRGLGASRNAGIRHAKGDYLVFLDADDVLMPQCLEQLLAAVAAVPGADVVCGSSLYWHGWTNRLSDVMKDRVVSVLDGAEPYEFIDLPLRAVRAPWATPSVGAFLVRAAAARLVGGFEESTESLGEDQYFYFKIGLRARVAVIDDCWHKYRQHDDSLTAVSARTAKDQTWRPRFLEWADHYLESASLSTPELRQAISQETLALRSQEGRARGLSLIDHKGLLRSLRTGTRRVVARLPTVRSSWHLLRAIREASRDSSSLSAVEIERDFRRCDPWDYRINSLEMDRHRREIQMIESIGGSQRLGNALEIGCAEGQFTEKLMEKCQFLVAADLSVTALKRARQRRSWGDNVSFVRLDLRVDSFGGPFDLIVAIHVLEYIKNPLVLFQVRNRLVESLRVGGHLVIGSCVGLTDFRERLWWSRYMLAGGRRMNAFIARHPSLRIVDQATHQLPGSTSYDLLLQRIR